MEQKERRRFLIQTLLQEDPAHYSGILIPVSERNQKDLLRTLFNLRPPRPVTDEFLAVQDAYLSEECAHHGITDSDLLPSIPSDPRIVLWQGDITTLKVDAIVNPAGRTLRGCFHPLHHNCADNLIHTRSGVQLRLACDALMNAQGHEEPIGTAKITPAFNLPSRFIIHTVGPHVEGELTKEHEAQLTSCYHECMRVAAENGIRTLAFCCLSAGESGFPKKRAAQIAVAAVRSALIEYPSVERVIFDVYKNKSFRHYQKLLHAPV